MDFYNKEIINDDQKINLLNNLSGKNDHQPQNLISNNSPKILIDDTSFSHSPSKTHLISPSSSHTNGETSITFPNKNPFNEIKMEEKSNFVENGFINSDDFTNISGYSKDTINPNQPSPSKYFSTSLLEEPMPEKYSYSEVSIDSNSIYNTDRNNQDNGQPIEDDDGGGGDDSGDDNDGILLMGKNASNSLEDILPESACKTGMEILFPFLAGGVGMVFAGTVLSIVVDWDVFKEVSEIFILVPALLGLKGNLEMTLASRLSTQANLGNMDTREEQWRMISGNLALTQVQATVVGLLASIFAIILGWVPEGKFNLRHGILLATSSVLTAALATLILGSLMIGVVMISRRLRINPDNVATPIAASLGDLTTITLLAFICQNLFIVLHTHQWISPTILVLLLALVPLWWYVSHHNKYTNNVLYTGWVPVIGAMFISSMGGLVLDYAVNKFSGIAVFQPVINGVGGNLVAVQASRLSTALHTVSTPGTLPENAVHGCPNPISTFFGKTNSARTSRVLMLMVVPGHLIFMLIIFFMHQTQDFKFTIPFVVIYLIAAVLQVSILLYIANAMVHSLWARGNDPDNSSIPYLTAIGDLLGTSLLAITFLLLPYFP